MNAQTTEMNQESSESYQMIKDEHLAFTVITSQILAGSRVLLSTYEQVVFSESVFYAVEFQGVTFTNCVFENCNFDFSHLRNCKFNNCSFVNCSWKASSSTKCVYDNCGLDESMDALNLELQNQISFTQSTDHTTDIYFEMVAA